MADTYDSDSVGKVLERIVGAWRLISWYESTPDGGVAYPLGENATGQIIYSADGHLSAQLMSKNVPRFRDDDWRKARPEECAEAWAGYFGYFGKFTIDIKQQALIHNIEGSWFPNLKGSEQIRFFHFDGNLLVLNADTAWGKVKIIWEKLS